AGCGGRETRRAAKTPSSSPSPAQRRTWTIQSGPHPASLMWHWAGRRGSLRGGGTAMSRPPAALSCSAAIWTPASSRRSWGLAGFWSQALGWQVAAEEPGEAVVWPPGYDYPDPAALPLVFVPVPEPKTAKNRVHLDLASSSAADQAATVRRLLSLGATPADI